MDIAKLIADMVRAGTDPDIVGRVAEAFVGHHAPIQPVPQPMSNAERQARWRERQKAVRAVETDTVTDGVMEDVSGDDITHFVTPVIGVSSPSSSLSPTPPILTTSSPSKTPEGEISLEKTVNTLPEANPKPVVEIVSAAERRFNRLVYPALPDDWAGFAAERGLSRAEAEELFELFANHWTAKAGRGGRKRDWPALWENWVIDALQRRAWRRKNHGRPSTKAGVETSEQAEKVRFAAVRVYIRHHVWNTSWGSMPSEAELETVRAKLEAGD